MATENELYILAVDLGTGGPKVALISTDGDIVGHEFEKTELFLLPAVAQNRTRVVGGAPSARPQRDS